MLCAMARFKGNVVSATPSLWTAVGATLFLLKPSSSIKKTNFDIYFTLAGSPRKGRLREHFTELQMKKYKQVPVEDIPCFAVYSDDFHYSEEWLDKMVSLWIQTRLDYLNGDFQLTEYRDRLLDGVIAASGGWVDEFRQAAREAGADPDDEELFNSYVAMHRGSAFDLIPRNAHASLCWVPNWDGGNLDNLIETHGLRSLRWRDTSLEYVEPGYWLAQLLKMVNVGSESLIAAAIEQRGEEGMAFAAKCGKSSFKVAADPLRPSIMTPADVITTFENSYPYAVPMMHCEVAVHALFNLDPRKDIHFAASRDGEVHVGLHDFVLNGAGHMDTYKGIVTVPAKSKGFVGAKRMRWTINSVYGIVKSYFYTTPRQD